MTNDKRPNDERMTKPEGRNANRTPFWARMVFALGLTTKGKELACLLVALLTSFAGKTVYADGKVFSHDAVPPGIPYQRAVLSFDGQRETLVLQTKYEARTPESEAAFGWVVPVPSVPDLATMPAAQSDSLFWKFALHSRPDEHLIREYFCLTSIVVCAVCGIATICLGIGSWWRPHLAKVTRRMRIACILAFLAFILSGMLLPGLARQIPVEVEVLKSEQVGVYDVKVLRSDDPKALIRWLKENEFRYSGSDTAVFDAYVQRGWCFVTAKLRPEKEEGNSELTNNGLIAPLILRFSTGKVVYPLALTATAGKETEVLLHVCSKTRMDCSGKLELLFAGPGPEKEWLPSWLKQRTDPASFWESNGLETAYLTTFRGRLTPQQMSEDLTLLPSKDTAMFRKRVFRW